MLARAAVLLVLAVALAAAGCGSDDGRGDYVKALNQAQTQLQQRFTKLGSRITPTSTPKQDQRTLSAYEDVVHGTVTDLKTVDPPSGLDTLHDRFVGELAGYGTAVRDARQRLDSDDPKTILAAQSALKASLARTGQRLNATISAINEKIKG
jgi:hypothetical protein